MTFVDTNLTKAKKLVNQGSVSDAKLLLEEILSKFPNNIRAQNAINNINFNHKAGNDLQDQTEIDDVNEVVFLFQKMMIPESLAKADLIYNNYPKNEKLNIVLGCVYDAIGNFNKALEYYKIALDINPKSDEAMTNMGVTLVNLGEIYSAIENYQKAIKININNMSAYGNLGNALSELAKFDDAIACFKKALKISPNHPYILNNLGHTYKLNGKIIEAQRCYFQSIALDPKCIDAHNNLAILYLDIGDYEKALASFRNSISIDENYIATLISMGAALADVRKEQEAIECFQKVINLSPKEHTAISNLLLLSNYSAEYTPDYVSTLHKDNGSIIESIFEPLSFKADQVERSQSISKIKLGFVSADLHQHSVTYFLEPLLQNINQEEFSIICYNNSYIDDAVTKRIKSIATLWHDVEPMTHKQLYSLIQKDEVDILIDLSGHTRGNRLPVFAMKPAKIQLTWLGYPNTTGLKSMDYRIVDHYTDPKSLNDHLYTEKLLRIDGSFLCFSPEENVPINKNNLMKKDNLFTFGSFNNLAKMSEGVLKCWAQILNQHENSRIMLKNKQLNSNYMRNIYLKKFEEHGINNERVILLSWSNSRQDHLNLYNSIDLALDTFPYNGTTTTFESLWMNVPVLCMEGNNHSGRVGYSILKNLGLESFISKSEEHYIEKALHFAKNREEVNELSLGLRDKLTSSDLCNAKKFTNKFQLMLKSIL
jgi:protein O-GlcNAc transferase